MLTCAVVYSAQWRFNMELHIVWRFIHSGGWVTGHYVDWICRMQKKKQKKKAHYVRI